MNLSDDNSPGERTYQECQQVLRRHEARLLTLPEVIGVGVGKSEDGELGLVLLMRRIPVPDQANEQLFPDSLDGIPIWLREIGSVHTQMDELSGE